MDDEMDISHGFSIFSCDCSVNGTKHVSEDRFSEDIRW